MKGQKARLAALFDTVLASHTTQDSSVPSKEMQLGSPKQVHDVQHGVLSEVLKVKSESVMHMEMKSVDVVIGALKPVVLKASVRALFTQLGPSVWV